MMAGAWGGFDMRPKEEMERSSRGDSSVGDRGRSLIGAVWISTWKGKGGDDGRCLRGAEAEGRFFILVAMVTNASICSPMLGGRNLTVT